VKQSVVDSLQWRRLSLSQLYLVVAGTSSCQVVEVSAVRTRLELQSSRALVAWRQSESPLIIAQVPAEVARPAAASSCRLQSPCHSISRLPVAGWIRDRRSCLDGRLCRGDGVREVAAPVSSSTAFSRLMTLARLLAGSVGQLRLRTAPFRFDEAGQSS